MGVEVLFDGLLARPKQKIEGKDKGYYSVPTEYQSYSEEFCIGSKFYQFSYPDIFPGKAGLEKVVLQIKAKYITIDNSYTGAGENPSADLVDDAAGTNVNLVRKLNIMTSAKLLDGFDDGTWACGENRTEDSCIKTKKFLNENWKKSAAKWLMYKDTPGNSDEKDAEGELTPEAKAMRKCAAQHGDRIKKYLEYCFGVKNKNPGLAKVDDANPANNFKYPDFEVACPQGSRVNEKDNEEIVYGSPVFLFRKDPMTLLANNKQSPPVPTEEESGSNSYVYFWFYSDAIVSMKV